jgi:OOP family OmpA-OmpF porin
VRDDRIPPSGPGYLGVAGEYDPASEDFAELRELLVGEERRRLEELEQRVEGQELSPEVLADRLPDAIALRAGRDQRLARALAPTIDDALSESVRRNPRDIATAIFPVLGPAIRKALAEAMAGLVESINRAVEHAFSLRGMRWRLEAWRTGTPYAQVVIKHALVYRVEQVFLIHAETGLLLQHVAADGQAVAHADLMSGMLTAIQDFVADSFRQQEEGRLRRFSVGELTVLVEPGPQAVLAAVVRGPPPETLQRRLQDALETIHFRLAAPFADFRGDAAPFVAARPVLEECLELELETDSRPAAGRRAWLRWAVPLALLVAVAALFWWRGQRRWNAALELLRAEPGIELVAAERSWGSWRMRGLRDPLAREPAAVLAGMGVDPANLTGVWTPFLSLEPSLVVTRARRMLGIPEGLTLRLDRDTLYAEGPAPLSWLGRIRESRQLSPGVAALELRGVTPTLPDDLAPLARQIEERLVLFDVGSAVPAGASVAVVDSVASSFGPLSGGIARLGYRTVLTLLGRTDASGSDAANQSLSRARAEVVRALLARRGVAVAAVTLVPLGTTDPLPAAAGLDDSGANRSVAFRIALEPLPGGAPR